MESLKFMTNETLKNQTTEPIFPEESSLIIEKILEKYGLAAKQREGIEKFINSDLPIEALEDLPGSKISKLVKDYGEKKISLEGLPILLEKELNVSEKEAKEISKDLEKTLLVFIKQAPIREKEAETQAIPIPKEESEITIPEESKTPSKKDVYRELIE